MRIWILFILVMIGCRQAEYEMTNMVPETIDVTEYIRSGDFQPDSCEGRLDRLIKTTPKKLDQSYEQELQHNLTIWFQSHKNKSTNQGIAPRLDSIDIHSQTSYQYSYFITTNPVDVYLTEIEMNDGISANLRLFIRLDNEGRIVPGYKESGWVINSCD